MTQVWQLLVFVAAIAGLIAFGFYRDKKEHAPPPKEESAQSSIYFPDDQPDSDRQHRGAAMSRIS